MFLPPKADFNRLLQAQVLGFQERFADIFTNSLIVLSVEKNLLSIECADSQREVILQNWAEISEVARINLGCQIVKMSPSIGCSEYTGQGNDSEVGDSMNTSTAAVEMPGRVAIETNTQPVLHWGNPEGTDTEGWISFEALAKQTGKDVKEIIRLAARGRIPSFRHIETLEEGLNRQGAVQLLTVWFQALYSSLPFQDMNAPVKLDEETPVESSVKAPEAPVSNGAAPVGIDAASSLKTQPEALAPLMPELVLPTDWTPKSNPAGGTYGRNPNPMTALENALLVLGIIPANADVYWVVMERLQRRRMDKEAKAFLTDIASFYSDKNQTFVKLREQVCKAWDEHLEKVEQARQMAMAAVDGDAETANVLETVNA